VVETVQPLVERGLGLGRGRSVVVHERAMEGVEIRRLAMHVRLARAGTQAG